MQDRVSLYPGRVRLTPVSGQENVYDMVRADEPEQEGTPLNKNAFLTDAVAALLGLDSDATPNNAFFELCKSRLHWWKKKTVEAGYQEFLHPNSSFTFTDDTESTTYAEYYYSSSVTIDQSTGEVSLASPSTIQISYQNQNHSELVGKYFMLKLPSTAIAPTPIYKSGTDSAATRDYYYDDEYEDYYYATYLSNCRKVEAVWVETGGDWEYVSSENESAYPTGTVDGVEWVYLGIPFENARECAKIAHGSYIGTGTVGSSNPNVLTFDFEPKIVFVRQKTITNYFAVFIRDDIYAFCYAGTYSDPYIQLNLTWDGNSLKWYYHSTNGASGQLNSAGNTYCYVALG